ncbi:MAG TPA: type I-E CRISPR-associated protein Cas5/CasD, partial [Polyangiaceae bacterium]
KSGVIGLLGSALGMDRDDDETLTQLATLSMSVRVDREGRVLRDYHTVGGRTFRGEPYFAYGTSDVIVTNRYYLMDACFVVGLSSDDRVLVERLIQAIKNPHWPLFLGRRSCPPARNVFLSGPMEGESQLLITQVPYQGDPSPSEPIPLRCIIEGAEGKSRADVPRSFRKHARRFDSRCVRDEWISSAELPGGKYVPVTVTA